jgi:hypothetical protein
MKIEFVLWLADIFLLGALIMTIVRLEMHRSMMLRAMRDLDKVLLTQLEFNQEVVTHLSALTKEKKNG